MMGRGHGLDSDSLVEAAAEYLCITKSHAVDILASVASYSLQLYQLKPRKMAVSTGVISSVVYGRVSFHSCVYS